MKSLKFHPNLYRLLRWWSIIVLLFSHNMDLFAHFFLQHEPWWFDRNDQKRWGRMFRVTSWPCHPLQQHDLTGIKGQKWIWMNSTRPYYWIHLNTIDRKNWWRSYCTPSYHLDQFKKSRCNVIQRGLLHHNIDQHVVIATEWLNGNSEAFAASSCLLFLLCPGELQWKSISSW